MTTSCRQVQVIHMWKTNWDLALELFLSQLRSVCAILLTIMRDIREDLRQRLVSITLQRGQLQARLRWLDDAEAHVKGLLDYEKMQAQMDQQPLFSEEELPTDTERSEVALFLRDVLADGRPRSLDELKKHAATRNIEFGEKNPGRVLHFALLGMAQSGIVEMVDKGVWQMKVDPPKLNGADTSQALMPNLPFKIRGLTGG